ncbi:MAG: ABC transporter permease subunit [Patescibacteria group bacterium]
MGHRHRSGESDRTAIITFGIALSPLFIILVAGLVAHADLLRIISYLGLSLTRLITAYGIALFIAVSLSLLLSLFKTGDRAIPFLDALQNIPSFALIPLFALAFGYSSIMIILFAVTSIVWPILFNVLSAMKTAREDLSEAATIFHCTGWNRALHFLLPVGVPAMVTGSLVGISIGWEAIIGAEIIGSAEGIGSLLNTAGNTGDSPVLFSGIAILLALVVLINKFIWLPLIKESRLYSGE